MSQSETVAEDRDYVLGTHDEELKRLGLQHRVWRARVLDVWAAAGITKGSRVVDLGCGPGYATLDLAEIVGPSGEVLAIERSTRFLSFARAACERRGLTNVRFLEADLVDPVAIPPDYDTVWCRWVASFVPNVPRLIEHVMAALRPGGKAIFHEYVDYGAFRTVPRLASFDAFLTEVIASWRAEGGEPDVADAVLQALHTAGFEILETTPLVFAVGPAHVMWQWPESFLRVTLDRWTALGRVTKESAMQTLQEVEQLGRSPNARIITPVVLQIVARKT